MGSSESLRGSFGAACNGVAVAWSVFWLEAVVLGMAWRWIGFVEMRSINVDSRVRDRPCEPYLEMNASSSSRRTPLLICHFVWTFVRKRPISGLHSGGIACAYRLKNNADVAVNASLSRLSARSLARSERSHVLAVNRIVHRLPRPYHLSLSRSSTASRSRNHRITSLPPCPPPQQGLRQAYPSSPSAGRRTDSSAASASLRALCPLWRLPPSKPWASPADLPPRPRLRPRL